ncbi:MAG: hypothetical protein H0W68_03370 [Gemmatimonadaceae bacterium]|nr:hypothetical protein [Gemmatimonadaceae bacterium]
MRSILPFVVLLVAACGGSDAGTTVIPVTPVTPVTPSAAPKDTIFTPGRAFSPSFVSVTAGSTIVFALGFDGTGHDVRFTAKPGAPAYIPVSVRKYVGVVMTTRGDFPFTCPTHPEMTGIVTVQ